MLHDLSVWWLSLSAVSFLLIAIDVMTHRQHMAIMNFVWPLTALYFGLFAIWMYFAFGRNTSNSGRASPHNQKKPFWQTVWIGVTHCGAGCTLGDFAAEWVVVLSGLTLFGSHLGTMFFFDFVLAYLVGIVFQYFSIAPMRHLTGWDGILAAIKADTISLIAFEIGMFAVMAWTHALFRLEPDKPQYWFLMQIAMVIGFFTSYPANWWLIRKGWKEAM